MSKIPSIAMIPSGYKAGKLYSIIPTNGDGDFNTSRASIATRVNENGLIEEVASNVPRLDYSDGGCPSLLLEGTATNLIPYSENFSDASWTKSNTGTLSKDTISPKGELDATTFIDSGLGGSSVVSLQKNVTVDNVSKYTYSIFAKKDQLDWLHIGFSSFTSVTGVPSYFDLLNGVKGISQGGVTTEIKDYGNGWYRCSAYFTTDAVDTTGVIEVGIGIGDNQRTIPLDGTSSIKIFGAQFEKGDLSSYIKTVGTTQTRTADTVSGSGNSTVINSTEGVLYGEFSNTENDNNSNWINLSDGSSSNWIFIGKDNLYVRASLKANNTAVLSDKTTLLASNNKVALSYKSGNIKLYINGVQIVSLTDTFSFNIPLNQLNFSNYNGGATTTKTSWKSVQVYKTALSDAELTTLTTI